MSFESLRRAAPFRRLLGVALLAAGTLAAALPASAHDFKAGDVKIGHPYAPPSPPGAVNGAAYLASLTNTGSAPDRLLRAASPVAGRTEIHTMTLDAGGVMRMREAGEIALAPGQKVEMRPGQGYHLMLIGLKQPMKEGDRFPVTLEFERGGKVDVEVYVEKPKSPAAMHDHAGGEHKH